jgi:hypothetical protein
VFVEKGGDQYGELLIVTVDGREYLGFNIDDNRVTSEYIDLEAQDLSDLNLGEEDNYNIYLHNGNNQINTDQGRTSNEGYYIWDNSIGEFRILVQFPTAPVISGLSVTNPQSQDIKISFQTNEQIGFDPSDLSVEISGPESDVLARSDFTESGTGPYTYEGTYTGSSDGDYTATIQVAKDPQGNDGANGQNDTVTVDTIPPTISNFTATNPQFQDVEVSFDSDKQLGEKSGDIDVAISGVESASLKEGDFTETGTGPYTYTATYDGNTDGEYTATLNSAKDPDGNDGASSQSDTITVDTVAPTISNVTLQNDGSDNLDLSFDSSETLSSLSITVDGPNATDVYSFNLSDFTESGGTYTLSTTQSYNDGVGTYTAIVDSAVDSSGNNGANGESDTYQLLDSTAPTIYNFGSTNPQNQDIEVSFDSDKQLGNSTGDITVSISGAETGTLNRGDFTETGNAPYTYTGTYVGSTDGDYTTTLDDAKDSAGNNGASGQSDTVTVDTTAPSISNVTLQNDGSDNLDFSFESNEQLGSNSFDIAVTVDGPNTNNVYSFNRSNFSETGNGPYTYTLTVTQPYDDGDGQYTATIDNAIDLFGNDGASGQNDSIQIGSSSQAGSLDYDFTLNEHSITTTLL